MISGLATAARLGLAAVSGVDALTNAFAQLTVKLALRARAIDDEAGRRMVEEMRAGAPRVTGNLVDGITWSREGADTVVEASAIRTSGGVEWNYAPFVEFGTSDTSAEPFFYEPADQVLADRGADLDDAIAAAGADAGF